MTRITQNLQYSLGIGGPGWTDFAQSLPSSIATGMAMWGLTLGEPFDPGGHCSWTAPTTFGARPAVFKVAFRHDESTHEAEGLAALRGVAGVEVFAFEHLDEHTTVMLLERCVPGSELRAHPESTQREVLSGLLREVWSIALPADHPFRPLASMAQRWVLGAERILGQEPHRLDGGLAREGLRLFRELAEPRADDVLLLTDLHASNVLASERRPWLIIDPKPYFGDRHYDVTQHLLNCGASLRADPFALTAQMAELAGLDVDRVRQWMVARCVQEALREGSPFQGAGDVARRLAR